MGSEDIVPAPWGAENAVFCPQARVMETVKGCDSPSLYSLPVPRTYECRCCLEALGEKQEQLPASRELFRKLDGTL